MSRAAFYGEPVDSAVVLACLTNMISMSFICWATHIAITNCGMIAVEAEILRQGNDELLNDLEEGIII